MMARNAPFEVFDKDARCSFCGQRKPDAFWVADITIYACVWCARDVLAKLLADAVVNHAAGDYWKDMSADLMAFERNFYRATALNLCRLMDNKSREVVD